MTIETFFQKFLELNHLVKCGEETAMWEKRKEIDDFLKPFHCYTKVDIEVGLFSITSDAGEERHEYILD